MLTGLWQIADMERDGRAVDLEAAATAMEPYVDAGLTTFDMADHYGSSEEIVGRFVDRHGEGVVQVATKWVPKPGPVTREDVRVAVERSLGASALELDRSAAVPRLELRGPVVSRWPLSGCKSCATRG